MTPLSPEQAEMARVHILENSLSLLEEARLLYAHGYFARSYTLAYLASEEVVKIPMIVRAVVDDMAGIPCDWEKVEKRIRSHRKKIDASHLHDYLQTDIRADDSDVRAYEAAFETTKYINDDKNNSIYCGFTDGGAISPLEHISESMARSMIDVSGQHIEWIKNQEEATRGMLSGGLSEEYLARYRKMREIVNANKSG